MLTEGRVVTQNSRREVIEDGAVVIEDGDIRSVGKTDEIVADYDAQRAIDLGGGVVIPGLINTHTHVNDRLQQGFFSESRGLYDWLYNVYWPGVAAMETEDYEIAATLYCAEAIQSGVTTFVDNDAEVVWEALDSTKKKLDVFDESGIRGIYAAGITDKSPTKEFLRFKKDIEARNPDTKHVPADLYTTDTDTALSGVTDLIDRHNRTADGRISVWPSPVLLGTTTKEALRRSYEIAENNDVMTTIHVSEAEMQERDDGLSNIEYLRNIGYLGDRALLAHCVQIDMSDVRLLAETETKVSHNYVSNMRLGVGYAPVTSMIDTGVTVGLGTDDSSLNDMVNPLSDLRGAVAGHKGYHRNPAVLDAQTALDMVTLDAAKSIGRADELGSIEPGKKADIVVLDMDHLHLTPAPDPVFALVHSVQGSEIELVVCDGEIVMEDREILSFDKPMREIMDVASVRATEIAEEVELG